MRRQAGRQYRDDSGRGTHRGKFVVAPIKGLLTTSALAGLTPEYAITLDNVICQPDSLVTRLGSAAHATGMATAGETLFSYVSASVSRIFCATNSGIYNVTAAGAVGAVVAALTEGDGRAVNMATSAGQYVYFFNGVDKPWLYDGTTWVAIDDLSTPAITGPTTTTLVDGTVYNTRLHLLATAYLGFYYLPVDSVGGATTAYPLGSLCTKGGYAQGQATWTVDGGTGMGDRYVVATSEGEVLIFQGTNPATAATWEKLGVFTLGKPIGRNCFVKHGGDLLYLSQTGIYPLSQILARDKSDRRTSFTSNIDLTIMELAREERTTPGWQIISIPQFSLILVNVPTTPAVQYVLNTMSGGWSRFTGWDARCWLSLDDSVYFASGTTVYKAMVGTADSGSAISWIVDTAYNRFGTLNQTQPLFIRPLIALNTPDYFSIGFAQDFTNEYISQTIGGSAGAGGLWDSGLWDTALWGGDFSLQRDWHTIPALGGLALSTRISGNSKNASYIILGFDYSLSKQGLIT